MKLIDILKNLNNKIKIDKPWGHEIIWSDSLNYLGKLIYIKKNESKCSYLKSENSKQQLIRLDKESDIEIWGIVIYSIHALR